MRTYPRCPAGCYVATQSAPRSLLGVRGIPLAMKYPLPPVGQMQERKRGRLGNDSQRAFQDAQTLQEEARWDRRAFCMAFCRFLSVVARLSAVRVVLRER